MIGILRIGLLGLFIYYVREVALLNPVAPTGSLLRDLPLIGEFLFVGLANAIIWAPWFGEKLAGTVTGSIVSHASNADTSYWSHRVIHWLRHHHLRYIAICWCVFEGLNRPWMPHPFVLGMKMAKKDSWLAAVFALEVYRFSNVYNCLEACQILERRGIKPRIHKLQEINLFIVESKKEVRPPRAPIPAPDRVPDPPMKRDQRIELFDDEEFVEERAETDVELEEGLKPGTESPAVH
ncbi:MAG: hypothetical protein ACKVJX_24845 [Verrucomicrobiia bacterium]|jgi:hypothetical protein